eukprot:gene13808-4737_t
MGQRLVLLKTPHGVIGGTDTEFVSVMSESFFVAGADSSEKDSVYCWGKERDTVKLNGDIELEKKIQLTMDQEVHGLVNLSVVKVGREWSIKSGFAVGTFKFTKDRRLCEKHFKPEMFGEDLQAKLLGYEPSCKKLKPTAVPTQFPHCKKPTDPRTFSTKRAMKRDRKQEDNYLTCIDDYQGCSQRGCGGVQHIQFVEEKVDPCDFKGNKTENRQKKANNGNQVSVDDLSQSNAGASPMLPKESAKEDLEQSMANDTDIFDSSFHVSDYTESESKPEDEKDLPNRGVDEKKVIVFESALDNLIMELRCPLCGLRADIPVPAISDTFEAHKKKVKEELTGNETWFSGDARIDSPGYSAKYGSYSLMGQKSKKIVTAQLVHLKEAESSNACEK